LDAAGGEKAERFCGAGALRRKLRGGGLNKTEGGGEAIHILAGERSDSFRGLNREL
jgi:hypothetical protein